MSFLIGIVSLNRTKEMTIYSILYEKRKNSSIRLYEIVLYNLFAIPLDMRLKFINYLLKKNTYDEDIHNLIINMKNTKMVGILIGQKQFWENVDTFINNYEVYYLPEQLLDELHFYLNNKTEITETDINIILKLIMHRNLSKFPEILFFYYLL